MIHVSACPDHETLARLLDPRTKEEDAAPLEQHLLTCQPCCEALREMEDGDTLVAVARDAATQLPADADVRRAIERLKAVRLPDAAIDETLASTCESTESAWGLEELLDPPQAEGELGGFAGYRVLRVLGAGGMGIVFEAHDPQLQRRIALKVMQRRLAARGDQRQRFLREARAAAAIDHPHIVTVHQVGEYRGVPFLAMQLLRGESLQDRLEREAAREGRREGDIWQRSDGGQAEPSRGGTEPTGSGAAVSASFPLSLSPSPLPPAECLRIARETAEALAEAHRRGLIHRDVKPANIWLESPGGWVKLLDFGLAHAAEDVHLTQTGAILGTPAYMSPEQARGEGLDARSDLFSLGAVLYKLATGDVPFRGANTMAVLTALATETPRPPIELNPGVPPRLNGLILRLLAKKPEQRFQSAEAVVEAIRAVEEECLVAGAERSDAPARRRPGWPLVAAAAATFMLAGIIVIIRDKDGKVIERRIYHDGVSAEVSQDDSETNPVKGTAIGRGASQKETGALTPPTALREPPCLEDWLKDREIITVAQNGTARFQTIQEALAALKPGQAVEILDRGPYRETLGMSLPDDTGLISRCQTVIEWNGKRKRMNLLETGRCHFLSPVDRFRLSGLAFVDYDLDQFGNWEPATMVAFLGEVLIENCYFQGALADRQLFALHVFSTSAQKPASCVVRDCIFDGQLNANAGPNRHDPRIAVERNWFRDMRRTSPLEVFGKWASVEIRQNVMGLTHGFTVNFVKNGGSGVLVFSHNTLPQGTLAFFQASPGPLVRIDHNVLANGVGLNLESPTGRSNLIKSWQVGYNHFLNTWQGDNLYPETESDQVGGLEFLSLEADQKDYLRIKDRKLMARAESDDEPNQVGAFPAGPAPNEGDWFTRLRERWAKVAPAPDGGKAADASPAVVGDSPLGNVAATLRERLNPLDSRPLRSHGLWLDRVSAEVPLVARLGDPRLGGRGELKCLAYSPDGGVLAAAGDDKLVMLYDTKSWEVVRSLAGHTSAVTSLAFHPRGKIIASGGAAEIKLWDVSTGEERGQLPGMGTPQAWSHKQSIAFVREGAELAVANGPTIKLYNAETGELARELKGHTGAIEDLAASADGRQIATCSLGDRTARVWFLNEEKEPLVLSLTEGPGHPAPLVVGFHPSGKTLAVGGMGWAVVEFDLETGKKRQELWPVTGDAGGYLNGLAYSPDGVTVAVGAHQANGPLGRVYRWDAATAAARPLVPIPGQAASDLAFSPDSRRLAVASRGYGAGCYHGGEGFESQFQLPRQVNRTFVVDPADGRSLVPASGHSAPASALAFAADGAWLASAGYDATVRLWNMDQLETTRILALPYDEKWLFNNAFASLAASPDGQWLAASAGTKEVRLWELAARGEPLLLPAASFSHNALAFSPDSRLLAIGAAEHALRLWSVASGKEQAKLTGQADEVRAVAFSPDGKRLASGGKGVAVNFWDVATGSDAGSGAGPGGDVVALGFVDSQRLAVGQSGGDLRLRAVPSGELLHTFRVKEPAGELIALAVQPGGDRLATAHADSTVRLWSVESGQVERSFPLAEGRAQVFQLAFTPEGRYLAAALADGSILLLRLEEGESRLGSDEK